MQLFLKPALELSNWSTIVDIPIWCSMVENPGAEMLMLIQKAEHNCCKWPTEQAWDRARVNGGVALTRG
jgi:hypothetical protein